MRPGAEKRLLASMSLIDSRYIDGFNKELEHRKKKRYMNRIKGIGGLAACICAVVGITVAGAGLLGHILTGNPALFPTEEFVVEDGKLVSYNGTSSNVNIPDGVTEITATAFSSSSTDITSINIGKNVEYIDKNAFTGLLSLNEFTVSKENSKYYSENGIIANYDGTEYFCAYINADDASYMLHKEIMNMQKNTDNYGKTAQLALGYGVLKIYFETDGSANCFVMSVSALGHEYRFSNPKMFGEESGVCVRQSKDSYIISLFEEWEESTYIFTIDDVYEITHASGEITDGHYNTDFVIRGSSLERYFTGEQLDCRHSAVFYEDITGDSIPEITVAFVSGTGTGVHTQDVHVFNKDTLEEYKVEDMEKNLTEHISFKHDNESYVVAMPEGNITILKSELDSEPEHLSDDVFAGNYYYYSVKDGVLRYVTACFVSMTETCGYIDVSYELLGDSLVYSGSVWYDRLPEWVISNGY